SSSLRPHEIRRFCNDFLLDAPAEHRPSFDWCFRRHRRSGRSSGEPDSEMTARPELSIVVPAFNEAKRIGDTLASMVSYLQANIPSFEIIVVADGNDGTREKAQEFAASSGVLI